MNWLYEELQLAMKMLHGWCTTCPILKAGNFVSETPISKIASQIMDDVPLLILRKSF